jgi:ABC-2 type transport system ATP-binding protein
MNAPAVSIRNIGFCYPGQSSYRINDLSLEIEAGDRFGLFGPNGAGKSTLMNCMSGLLPISKGSISIFGHDTRTGKKKIKQFFGLVPQDFSFYQELTPVQNLEFFGAWSDFPRQTLSKRIVELLNTLGLGDVMHKPVQQFSGGMKRRVNLAIGVISHPKILFLDEPTVGVDIQSRHAILNFLRQMNEEGTTLIYTSHQLNEAEELCNKIALIENGNIIAHNTLENLLKEHREEGLEGLYLNLTGHAYRDS